MQCGERRDCRDRRRNATGNRFQEGGAARYRAEYLRLSNAPTSAAATCDNTVRCACAAPRTLTTPPRCIPNDIGLETSREISAHSIRASGPYSIPLARRILRDVTSGYILITKLPWSMQKCFDFKTNVFQ